MEIIKNIKRPYIYSKIINYISKIKNEIILLKYNDSIKQKVFENLKNSMKTFAEVNGIIKNLGDSNEIIIKNLFLIISGLKEININQNLIKKRIEHLQILGSLLNSLKNNEQEDNEIDNNIIKINDFIITYIGECSTLLFGKNFGDIEYNSLIDLFLYLIFEVKEEKFIRKLKILIYKHLYKNKNIMKFIKETSENIHNLNIFDDEILKKYQNKYNEFENLNIFEVSKNASNFFNVEKNYNDGDILKFFTPKNIKNNYKMIENNLSHIGKENIVIDSLKYEENKLHLFSPEFLISNGLKSKIELNDIEIFNDDNYAVDIFARYINKIIEKINESINNDNFNTDFITNNLIKTHKLDFLHYISAKLDYKTIRELESQENNYFKNDFILLKVEDGINNYKKTYSEYLESIINEKLIKNIDKKDLIYLPNILFMFNLKIPVLDEKNNTLIFKSLHLDFFHEEKKDINENYYYGYKVIDAFYQNISEKEYNVFDSQYFHTNITFVKSKNDKGFILQDKKEFSIFPKSILFCEIKNTFPNTQKGNEEVLKIKIEQQQKKEIKKDYSICYIDENDPLYAYNNQLIKLIKKFRYFFKTLKDKKINKDELNLRMIFVYDLYDIDDNKYNDIKILTERLLNKYKERFEGINDIIFELVFFDNFKLNQDIKTQLEEEKENNKKLNENNKQLTQNLEEEKENNKKLNENNKKLTQKLEENNELLNIDEYIQKILNDPNLSMEEKMTKMKNLIYCYKS